MSHSWPMYKKIVAVTWHYLFPMGVIIFQYLYLSNARILSIVLDFTKVPSFIFIGLQYLQDNRPIVTGLYEYVCCASELLSGRRWLVGWDGLILFSVGPRHASGKLKEKKRLMPQWYAGVCREYMMRLPCVRLCTWYKPATDVPNWTNLPIGSCTKPHLYCPLNKIHNSM